MSCHLSIFPKILPYRKYPEISCVEEREKYKAVFNDQYQEYKDLHRDVSSTVNKFRELDATMARLLREGKSQEVRWMYHNLYSTLSLTIQTTSVTGFQYLIRGEKVIIRPPYCRYILNISVST